MAEYKRNYLTSVTVRLDFAIPPIDLDRELPEGLVAEIQQRFPIPAEPVDRIHRDITLRAPAGNLEVTGTQKWKRWDFYTKRRDKFVRIERDFFCIQYNKYKSFRILKNDFVALMKRMAACFADATYRRLGLRYVDTFSFPREQESGPLDWRRWIDKRLLVALTVPPRRERSFISGGSQNLELNFGDMQLRFQYGVRNPDYPSPVRQKQFVFDTDAFYDGMLEANDIPEKLDQFHKKIKEYFEAHITDEMREHLNARRRR